MVFWLVCAGFVSAEMKVRFAVAISVPYARGFRVLNLNAMGVRLRIMPAEAKRMAVFFAFLDLGLLGGFLISFCCPLRCLQCLLLFLLRVS